MKIVSKVKQPLLIVPRIEPCNLICPGSKHKFNLKVKIRRYVGSRYLKVQVLNINSEVKLLKYSGTEVAEVHNEIISQKHNNNKVPTPTRFPIFMPRKCL